MAQETIEIEVTDGGGSAARLDKIDAKLDNLNEGLDKNEKAAKKAGKSNAGMADKVAGAAVAFAAIKVAIFDAVRAYADLDAAQGRLSRSFDRAGASARDLAAAEEQIRQTRDRVGVGIQAQTDALRSLVDATGDVKIAQQDLALAVDIASQENIDLSRATEMLRKARKGEVEELKQLNGLNKDSAQELGRVEDQAKRSELAISFLSDAYAGAAEENRGLADDLAATEDQLKEVQAATGEVAMSLIEGSGSLAAALLVSIGLFEEGEFTLGNFARGMTGFASATAEAAGELTKMVSEAGFSDFLEMVATGGFAGMLLGTNDVATDLIDRAETRLAERRAGGGGGAPAGGGKGKSASDAVAFVGPAITPQDELRIQRDKEKLAKEEAQAEQKRALARQSSADAAKREAEADRESAESDMDRLSSVVGGAAGDAAVSAEETTEQIDMEQRRLEILREQDEVKRMILESEMAMQEIRNDADLNPEIRRLKLMQEQQKLQEKLAGTIKKGEKEKTKVVEETTKAIMTEQQALQLAGQGAMVAADLFGAGEQVKAGIRGAFETAEAIAAGASGNVPGAIAHGLAAAQFFAVAGGLGAKGGGGRGGAGVAPPSSATPDRSRDQAGATSEGMRGDGGRQATVINMNFRSISKPTEDEAQQMLEQVRRAEGGRL